MRPPLRGLSEDERPSQKRCPKCGGKLRRLVGTGAGIVFKGSGFYATDYRSESYKSQKKKESGEQPKPKDESKPKAKPKPGTGSGDGKSV